MSGHVFIWWCKGGQPTAEASTSEATVKAVNLQDAQVKLDETPRGECIAGAEAWTNQAFLRTAHYLTCNAG